MFKKEKCVHCGVDKINISVSAPFISPDSRQLEKVTVLFCSFGCLQMYLLDDLCDNPLVCWEGRAAWKPVLRQLHDELAKLS